MNKKQFAITLSKLKQMEQSKLKYEQYSTPGDIAVDILIVARQDVVNKSVLDLGCGNGILAIGAKLLGAKNVTAVDIDGEALAVAVENMIEKGLKISIIKADVENLHLEQNFDTCIMNPPFGVQNEHADRRFLAVAFRLCDTVYSLHKTESKKFLESFASDSKFSSECLRGYDFPIKASQPFHRKRMHRFPVSLWRFRKH
jgi:putative methylase